MIQIKDQNGKLLKEIRNANLIGADLWGADLRGADLRNADLRNADLIGADLWGANLIGADLRGANLMGANLRNATIPWTSHQLISEILVRAAGEDLEKISLAGIVRVKTDWCCEHFEKMEHPAREWAISELAKWVKEEDDAPGFIREAAALLEV